MCSHPHLDMTVEIMLCISTCLCVVKQVCLVASVLFNSVNIIQLKMKSSDGAPWVIVAEKWGVEVAN